MQYTAVRVRLLPSKVVRLGAYTVHSSLATGDRSPAMFHVLDRSESLEQWIEWPHPRRFSDSVVQAYCMWNHPPCRRFRRRRLGAATGLLPLLILVDRVSGFGSDHAFGRWKDPLNSLSMSRFPTRLNAKVPTAELAVGEGVAAHAKRKSERKATTGTEKKKETEPI